MLLLPLITRYVCSAAVAVMLCEPLVTATVLWWNNYAVPHGVLM